MQISCRCGTELEIVSVNLDYAHDMDIIVEQCESCETDWKEKVEAAENDAANFEDELVAAQEEIAELRQQLEEHEG